jgi:hypothetical protein
MPKNKFIIDNLSVSHKHFISSVAGLGAMNEFRYS